MFLIVQKLIHLSVWFDSGAESGTRQEIEQGNSDRDVLAITTEK